MEIYHVILDKHTYGKVLIGCSKVKHFADRTTHQPALSQGTFNFIVWAHANASNTPLRQNNNGLARRKYTIYFSNELQVGAAKRAGPSSAIECEIGYS
jgi:hypothetical protein